jgi:anti-sigma B factor antagonist
MTDVDGAGLEFRVAAEADDDRADVTVEGEVDIATAPLLREQLQAVIDAGAKSVSVDLAGVDFIDSAGLGVLIGALKRLRERGGQLELRGLQAAPRKVIEITGLHEVFTVVD